MGLNILGIGASALNAAQIGVATTGNNIANAATPGYSRQVVVQGAVAPQGGSSGFVGSGTEVVAVNRVYSQFLTTQVQNAQTSSSQLSTYSTQIKQIDFLLANSSAGVSPALQDFFKGVQDVSADPSSASSRQALLSSAQALAARFQGIDSQLNEIRAATSGQIISSVQNINVYANQIAGLNDAIGKAQGNGSKSVNNLLDQRDQAVNELSKEVKVFVVRQGESYNVFIGSGQPLVIGDRATSLITTTSLTDSSKIDVSSKAANGVISRLSESSLPGGNLGGLFEFRSTTLDNTQNTLGRVATNLATTFNAQHELGQTQTGTLGGAFFNVAVPVVTQSVSNIGTGAVTATIGDATALAASDYRLQYIQTASPSYKLTRLSDGNVTNFDAPAAPGTVRVDGVDIGLSGAPSVNDEFLIRPVINGAAGFSVAITDKSNIAVGAPIRSSTTSTNNGTGTISAPTVNSVAVIPSGVNLTYTAGNLTGFPAGLPVTVTTGGVPTTYPAGTPVPYAASAQLSFGGVQSSLSAAQLAATPVVIPAPYTTLRYSASTNSFSGFPSPLTVTVVANGTTTTYAPGVPVPYTPDAKISFGGISLAISGAPLNGDVFNVSSNANGVGDNRNALLLGQLQTKNTLDNGTTTYQGAYSQLVSTVGNKAHELAATQSAVAAQLEQAVTAQQSESGVNLDEEAANLLRYQQAYQAAGKLIQTASTLFSVLLSLGGN
jgi:flagellar hook-associated protein 1 FlgK